MLIKERNFILIIKMNLMEINQLKQNLKSYNVNYKLTKKKIHNNKIKKITKR